MTISGLLRGSRVWLDTLDRDDTPIMARWERDSDFLRLSDTRPAVPRTAEAIWREVEAVHKSSRDYQFGIRLTDTDELIGLVELDGINWQNGTSFLGIGIGQREYRGYGYGGDAMALILTFAFDEMNLHRISLTVFGYNTAAIRLYERLGFTREGVAREFLHRDGQRFDMYYYGLLRREWDAMQG
jgi:RimJ/RimL family protein N-acetyltransferase